MAGTASSLVWAPNRLWLGHPSRLPKPLPRCQTHRGEEGACSEHFVHNSWHAGHGNRERCSLSPKGPGPKVLGSNVCNTCLPSRFRAPNNVDKYDGRTNPSVWLEDYHLACRVGRAEDDLLIIQFLPIYLANMTRAWLDLFQRNLTNC
jgi:hypothetical protein